MKINSITTECLSADRQVIAFSKTTFNKNDKPEVDFRNHVFTHHLTFREIKKHMEFDRKHTPSLEWFLVTIRTNKGRFVQSYAKDAVK